MLVYFKISTGIENFPMSIQQCYEAFFPSHLQTFVNLNDFKVYSNLTRLGFICRRIENTAKLIFHSTTEESCNQVTLDQKKEPIKPLINRCEHGQLTKSQIYDRLDEYMPKLVDKNFMNDLKEKLIKKHQEKFDKNNFKEFYDVFLPNKNFKKSSKQTNESATYPNYKLFTSRTNKDQLLLPNSIDFIQIATHTDTNCVYAFVNQSNGTDVSYYRISISKQLPSIY